MPCEAALYQLALTGAPPAEASNTDLAFVSGTLRGPCIVAVLFLQPAASKQCQDHTSACFKRQPTALCTLLLPLPIHPAGNKVRPTGHIAQSERSGQSHLHPRATSPAPRQGVLGLAAGDGAGVVRCWQGQGIEQVLEGHKAGS